MNNAKASKIMNAEAAYKPPTNFQNLKGASSLDSLIDPLLTDESM